MLTIPLCPKVAQWSALEDRNEKPGDPDDEVDGKCAPQQLGGAGETEDADIEQNDRAPYYDTADAVDLEKAEDKLKQWCYVILIDGPNVGSKAQLRG